MNDNKTPKDERAAWFILRSFLLVITVLFAYFGYIHKPAFVDDPFVTDNLWDALHPTSFLNVIGIVLWFTCLFFLSGIWQRLTGELYLPINSTWTNYVGFACGALGILLIFV